MSDIFREKYLSNIDPSAHISTRLKDTDIRDDHFQGISELI